jgi:PiT family inorganic phosphate transporter
VVTILLVVLAVGFAFSMGAHYTGACMGMPHALRAISAWRALLIMAPLTLLGATLVSHGVEHTVGHNLLTGAGLSITGLVIVVGVAFALTSLFNVVRIPTSTIQILVFTVVGVGLVAGIGVRWSTIATLALIWIAARRPGRRRAASGVEPTPSARTAVGGLAVGLVAVGALASFTMGGNDVANATGSLVGSGTFSPLVAGLVGGLGLAAGVLTWGKPLLRKVAFDIVTVDRPMATAAQLVQAVVVLAAVAFGFFTSMNQALIGAMTGAAAARGRHTVHPSALEGVVRGWVIGPGAGIALGYLFGWLVVICAGSHTLVAP